jgi:hypothetical protein
MSGKLSRKQKALLEAAGEYTPIVEYDVVSSVAEEAQPTQSETQPGATDCASEAVASHISRSQDTTSCAGCQEIGPENGQNDPKMAEIAPETPALSLAEIQAEIAEAAVEKARGLARDLAEARAELAADEAKYAAAVADAGNIAAQARDALAAAKQAAEQKAAAVCQAAEKAAEEAVAVLGNGAQVILDQLIAAQEAELVAVRAQSQIEIAAAEAALAGAEAVLAAACDERDVALALDQALVRDIENDLAALIAASPAAAQAVEESRQVTALVAEARAFQSAQVRDARALERLVGQLSPYAYDHPEAAYAISGLQQYAKTWYADQICAEIAALEPGKGFEERLETLVAQAEESGVTELIAADVEAARRRDRQALAEKGKAARLFARDLAKGKDMQPGDVIAYRAGRVTVFRSLDGNSKYRVQAVYILGNDNRWTMDGSKAVGRVVSKQKIGRHVAVRAPAQSR